MEYSCLERPCPRSVRRSISVVSPPPPTVRQGDQLASSVRPTEQMFVPSPRASARRAEGGRSRARGRPRTRHVKSYGRRQRRPRRISQLLPPLAWASSKQVGGTRPPRASNKDLGSRRLETLSGRSDIMGARKMISSSLRRFWSAPRESAFPPLRQEGGTARERGRAARRRELRQWRRWGNRRWPGGRRAEHGRSGRATSLY